MAAGQSSDRTMESAVIDQKMEYIHMNPVAAGFIIASLLEIQ